MLLKMVLCVVEIMITVRFVALCQYMFITHFFQCFPIVVCIRLVRNLLRHTSYIPSGSFLE